ncbi:hypothetical protein BRARA_E01915 [Brassica rapa]|uniref:DUF4283 domain-containing protein n=1 Tax=Brassica campestris TaxID=3711 RepID=A0A397ZKC4_BRACM|nr:hypothetical protein BRARA_E01915 [Brassica rapa]
MEEAEPLWSCYAVGYFMHDAPHIGSIHATVNRIWASPLKKSKIDVQFIGKTTVLFRIEDAGIRSRVIKRKFWHISDVPLMVGEWTPETARAPPDLSAMPLWVDLLNVPGYLYSKKGLSFLSRTPGKFIKLHTNTERCVRLDVARVLVEVDLTKPLPNKISFKGREGTEVVVSISYPWLPPWCSLCSKWGHNSKDCHSKGKESERSVKDSSVLEKVVAGNDYVVMEGFSTKDASEKSASEIVNKLMEELETMSGKASLSGDSNTASAVGLVESSHSVAPENESWALVSITNHGSSSPSRAIRTVGCASPNGFQVLQDIREEGEIDEEDNDKKDADETGILTNSMVSRVWNETAPLFHSHSALRRFQDKLKALKSEMRALNRDMFGDLPGRVKQANADLCAKQTEAMQNPQTSTFEAASDAWEHWHHISGIEEQFYYQKSRVQWLGLGDRNS